MKTKKNNLEDKIKFYDKMMTLVVIITAVLMGGCIIAAIFGIIIALK